MSAPAPLDLPLDLDAISKRADAASKAPWDGGRLCDPRTMEPLVGEAAIAYVTQCIAAGGDDFYGVTCQHRDGGRADVAHTGNGPNSRANADFIQHAREDVPALIAALKTTQEALKDARLLIENGDFSNGVSEYSADEGVLMTQPFLDRIDAALALVVTAEGK